MVYNESMKFSTWREFVEAEAQQLYFRVLMNRVDVERERFDIYPSRQDMFSCFAACPLDRVKVVIIGQDPYHGPGQAHGMSFSVRSGVKLPPSLQNIFKEISAVICRLVVFWNRGVSRAC